MRSVIVVRLWCVCAADSLLNWQPTPPLCSPSQFCWCGMKSEISQQLHTKVEKGGIIKANNACRALHLKNIYNCFRSLFSTFTCLLWSDVHLQLSHCLDCLVYKWFSCSEEETAIGWKAMKYGIFIFLAGWIVITFPYDPLSFSAKRRVILSLSW